MEFKDYLVDVYKLTKIGELKWSRRESADHIYDCKVNEKHTISLHYGVQISIIITMGVKEHQQAVQIARLNLKGDTYDALGVLWDTVYMNDIKDMVKVWNKELPTSKIRSEFGPTTTK